MGKKKQTERTGPRDRIGESVDLDKCPVCPEHADCFACLEGKCTALKESGGTGCVFYKPTETVVRENKRIVTELRRKRRSDLIRDHAAALAAMGAFDDEIREAENTVAGLESFRIADYEKALSEVEQKEENHRKEGMNGNGIDDICKSAMG